MLPSRFRGKASSPSTGEMFLLKKSKSFLKIMVAAKIDRAGARSGIASAGAGKINAGNNAGGD